MVKRFTALCIALLLLACLFPAAASEQRVFDYAGLFTAGETAELEARIAALREELAVDIVILTSLDAEGKSSIAYADDFYDAGGFGTGADYTGVLFFIDMDNRVPTVSTCGEMSNILNDRRLEALLDDVWYDLSEGNYAGAAGVFLDDAERYVNAGVEEGQYQYDPETGELLTGRRKRLAFLEVLIALAAGAIVMLIVHGSVRRGYSLKGSTYSYDVNKNAMYVRTGGEDTFLHTSQIRTPKAPPPSGGGGGGSAMHRSSSGRMHGGGSGRRF